MHTAIDTELGGARSFLSTYGAATTVEAFDQPMLLSAKRCADGNGTLTYLFFSEEYVDIQRAKAMCAKCTSRVACLSTALENAEPWGVWGGELIDMGRVVEVKRPRGRPPTKSRPAAAIEEVPIPAHLVA